MMACPPRHQSRVEPKSPGDGVLAPTPWLTLVEPTDRILEAFEFYEGQWLSIASAKDEEPVSIHPFDATTFSLGDLWLRETCAERPA